MTAIDVLKAYEQWEADLIMNDEAWRRPSDGEPLGLPHIPQCLWDRLLEIQDLRNKVLQQERK